MGVMNAKSNPGQFDQCSRGADEMCSFERRACLQSDSIWNFSAGVQRRLHLNPNIRSNGNEAAVLNTPLTLSTIQIC